MTSKVEILFMVYRSNGTGTMEKRIMELSDMDIQALGRGNSNQQLKSWMLLQFPGATDVKIQVYNKLLK